MVKSQDEDYLNAGFAGSLGFGRKPAMIVIDMVMAYFDRSSPMYASVEAVAESNLRLLGVAYRKRIPVIFTRQFFDERTSDEIYVRKVPALKLLRPDSPFTAIEPSLPTHGASVMIKHFPSAFHRTDLGARLESLAVDTLIITGLTTSGCVRATAMDALLHNLRGIVVREAVGDRDQRQHEANLFDINAKLGDVRSESDVIGWLNER